jgi:pSer/pThr/pTyr-binding forkhead associated (FHA) protein
MKAFFWANFLPAAQFARLTARELRVKKPPTEETLVMEKAGATTEPRIPSHQNYSLVVLEGKNQGEEFKIDKWTIIIGRDASVSDFVVDDPGASRSHACLEFETDGFCIEDLESTNGTLVNEKLATRVSLKHGDKITIGKTTLQFVVEKMAKGAKVYHIKEIE